MPELVALFKAVRDQSERTSRIYSSMLSPWGKVVVETEFESLTEYAEWWENPKTHVPGFMDKVNELREAGGSGEVWILE